MQTDRHIYLFIKDCLSKTLAYKTPKMKIPNPKTICDAVQKFSSKVRVRRDGLSKGINCLLKADLATFRHFIRVKI